MIRWRRGASRVVPYSRLDPAVRSQAILIGFVIGGASTCLLASACLNVGGLLLSWALTRRREFAIKMALGATRGTLVRQLLIETLCVSMAGGALGVLFAMWTAQIVPVAVHDGRRRTPRHPDQRADVLSDDRRRLRGRCRVRRRARITGHRSVARQCVTSRFGRRCECAGRASSARAIRSCSSGALDRSPPHDGSSRHELSNGRSKAMWAQWSGRSPSSQWSFPADSTIRSRHQGARHAARADPSSARCRPSGLGEYSAARPGQ